MGGHALFHGVYDVETRPPRKSFPRDDGAISAHTQQRHQRARSLVSNPTVRRLSTRRRPAGATARAWPRPAQGENGLRGQSRRTRQACRAQRQRPGETRSAANRQQRTQQNPQLQAGGGRPARHTATAAPRPTTPSTNFFAPDKATTGPRRKSRTTYVPNRETAKRPWADTRPPAARMHPNAFPEIAGDRSTPIHHPLAGGRRGPTGRARLPERTTVDTAPIKTATTINEREPDTIFSATDARAVVAASFILATSMHCYICTYTAITYLRLT